MGAFLSGPCATTDMSYPSLVSLPSAVIRNKLLSHHGGREGDSVDSLDFYEEIWDFEVSFIRAGTKHSVTSRLPDIS